jgi:hypothetical protein
MVQTAPAAPPAPHQPNGFDDLIQQGGEAVEGFKKGLNQTGETAMKVLHSVPGVGAALDSTPGFQKSLAQTHQIANQPNDTIAGKTGEVVENIAEWMAGDEALKGLSYGQRIAKLAPVIRLAEKFPRLAEALNIGIKTAAGSGVQAAAHGANAEDSAKAAAIGGATGGVIGGGAKLVKDAIQHISPTVENIGGTEVTRLASQHPHATTAQSMAATAEHSSPVQQAQQRAGQEIISNSAKKSAAANLTELNEGRTVEQRNPTAAKAPYKFTIKGPGTAETTEGQIAHQPRKQQIGNRAVEGKGPTERQVYQDPATGETRTIDTSTVGATNAIPEPGTPPQTSHKSPTFQMQPEVKPGSQVRTDTVRGGGDIVTEDPATARAHIGSLNDAIDEATDPAQRAQLESQRADLQRQMGEYHASKQGQGYSPYHDQPTFSPVDISKSVSRVGSFGDAADELENGAKEVYNRLDDVTGGRFTDLREENKRAWNAVSNGGGDAAQARLTETQRKLTAMLDGTDGQVGDSVNPTDLSYANEAWKKAQVLRDVHSKIEGAFDTSIGASDRANAYRGFNGNQLRKNIKTLTDSYGERPLIRVIGQDQFNNLNRLADITRTQADRAKFGGGVNHVTQWLIRNEGKVASVVGGAGGFIGGHIGGYEGAVAGATAAEAAYAAARVAMRAIATNPKIGQQFTTAIQYGARPTVYGPMIANMIRKDEQQAK